MYHKTSFPGFYYTDGIAGMAASRGARWLIDAIASYQLNPVLSDGDIADFQIWELSPHPTKNSARLTCRADSDEPAAITRYIEYTDFFHHDHLRESVKIYVERGEFMVMMLPDER